MQKYILGLYEKSMPNSLSIRDKLKAAKKAGFDFLELSVDETDEKLARLDMTEAECREITLAIQETGVPIRTMCLSGQRKYPFGSLNETTASRAMEIMRKAIDLSVKLGIRIIMLAGYDVFYEESSEETWARFYSNLKMAVEMAAKAGVILGFETMDSSLDTVEKCMKYVTMINSPYLQVYPDIGNITNAAVKYGHDVFADYRKGAGHIVATHLKETVPGVFREVPFGTGHVNFEDNIRQAIDMGVRMFVAELWDVKDGKWYTNIVDACNFLRNKFPKL